MIALLILAAWLTGYTLTAAAVIRRQQWGLKRCHGIIEYREKDCVAWAHNRTNCWRPGPRGSQVGVALLLPLAWPLLILPAAAWWIATRKPTEAELAQRIADLEKQLNMR